MRPPSTRRAALAAGVIAATVALATLTSHRPPDGTSGPPATASPTTRAADQAVEEFATSGPTSRESAVELDGLPPKGFIGHERPRALAVARRFLDGYFAFEARERWRWGARQVAATATPALAAELLAGGAALSPAMDELPPRAEVYAIDLEFDKPPTTALIRAEVERGTDRSDIAVIATHTETKWTITAITE